MYVCVFRRKATSERKVSILMYGFPPGVGATGTAALLNVPRSMKVGESFELYGCFAILGWVHLAIGYS